MAGIPFFQVEITIGLVVPEVLGNWALFPNFGNPVTTNADANADFFIKSLLEVIVVCYVEVKYRGLNLIVE